MSHKSRKPKGRKRRQSKPPRKARARASRSRPKAKVIGSPGADPTFGSDLSGRPRTRSGAKS